MWEYTIYCMCIYYSRRWKINLRTCWYCTRYSTPSIAINPVQHTSCRTFPIAYVLTLYVCRYEYARCSCVIDQIEHQHNKHKISTTDAAECFAPEIRQNWRLRVYCVCKISIACLAHTRHSARCRRVYVLNILCDMAGPDRRCSQFYSSAAPHGQHAWLIGATCCVHVLIGSSVCRSRRQIKLITNDMNG